MPIYLVTGTWKIHATSKAEAESLIENAVAGHTEADLDHCEAELTDDYDDNDE